MPIAQGQPALDRLAAAMSPMSDFQLTAFHDLVTLSGSFVIALAVTESKADSETLWMHSRIDELWQIEQWGADEEAAEHAEIKREAFSHAAGFYHAA